MRIWLWLSCLAVAACVTVRQLEVTPLELKVPGGEPIVVLTPVKAHLEDGSTVVFPKGIHVIGDAVKGQGFQYDLTLEHSESVMELHLDDIVAVESFQTPVDRPATAVASTAATAGGGFVGLALVKALFGSCPTTYSLDGDTPLLEAESFSYSIAPGFEARDVDRLGLDPGAATTVELEMRNEALETHYVNHVELLEVEHAPNESVYPDPKGRALITGRLVAPDQAVDSSGRDVGEVVVMADGQAWHSTSERLRRVSTDDMLDFIDLEFTVPADSDNTALVLRLRNSLLNTVLLYDVMLNGQGFRALDWMGEDLNRLGPTFRLARWYQKEMGMRVKVWRGGRFRNAATIADTGPIAWNEIAVPVDAEAGDTLRVRLEFIADNWRLDHAALATDSRRSEMRKIAVTEVRGADDEPLPLAQRNLRSVDDGYLITKPGEHVRLHFDIGEPTENRSRSYFMAAEGYYIEWMRKEWLRESSTSTFEPNDQALLTALQRWEPRRDAFRQQFESTRIPVR